MEGEYQPSVANPSADNHSPDIRSIDMAGSHDGEAFLRAIDEEYCRLREEEHHRTAQRRAGDWQVRVEDAARARICREQDSHKGSAELLRETYHGVLGRDPEYLVHEQMGEWAAVLDGQGNRLGWMRTSWIPDHRMSPWEEYQMDTAGNLSMFGSITWDANPCESGVCRLPGRRFRRAIILTLWNVKA